MGDSPEGRRGAGAEGSPPRAPNRVYPYPELPGRENSVLMPYPSGRSPRAHQVYVCNSARGSPRYYRDGWKPRSRCTSVGLRFWWEAPSPVRRVDTLAQASPLC